MLPRWPRVYRRSRQRARAGHGGGTRSARLLFADVVGFSHLSEDQIPEYVAGFLGAVAGVNRRTQAPLRARRDLG